MYQWLMASIRKYHEETPVGIAVPGGEASSTTSVVCDETEETLEDYKTPQVEDISSSTFLNGAPALTYETTSGQTPPSPNSSNANAVVKQKSEMEGSTKAGRESGSIDLASTPH